MFYDRTLLKLYLSHVTGRGPRGSVVVNEIKGEERGESFMPPSCHRAFLSKTVRFLTLTDTATYSILRTPWLS